MSLFGLDYLRILRSFAFFVVLKSPNWINGEGKNDKKLLLVSKSFFWRLIEISTTEAWVSLSFQSAFCFWIFPLLTKVPLTLQMVSPWHKTSIFLLLLDMFSGYFRSCNTLFCLKSVRFSPHLYCVQTLVEQSGRCWCGSEDACPVSSHHAPVFAVLALQWGEAHTHCGVGIQHKVLLTLHITVADLSAFAKIAAFLMTFTHLFFFFFVLRKSQLAVLCFSSEK